MSSQYATSNVGSPDPSLFSQSPHSSIQPRHKNRATYVQRWKVLRERNKNLPKLDFNAKANGIPKKFQAASSFSRSYTYDSMKLPSISTCSVVTGVSGKSVHSDGYRRKDTKASVQEHSLTSDSYTDLTVSKEHLGLSANLSKSLQSLDDKHSPDQTGSSKHRYERISYQKHLSNRRRSNKGVEKEPVMLSKEKTVLGPKSDRTHNAKDQNGHKDHIERQFVYVKNHRKERQNFPHILSTLKKETETHGKREGKSEFHLLEQSGIYQIDLSSVRNEIPPASHLPHPPVGSANTERSYKHRRQPRSSKYGSAGVRAHKPEIEKKWRDDCDCLRCEIMRRQYAEGDIESYKNWGNYPCMKLSKSRMSDAYYDISYSYYSYPSYNGYYTTRCYPNDTKPIVDSSSPQETLTLTPDDVTIKSPPTTGACSPKSTLALSPAQPVNITLYDTDLIACD